MSRFQLSLCCSSLALLAASASFAAAPAAADPAAALPAPAADPAGGFSAGAGDSAGQPRTLTLQQALELVDHDNPDLERQRAQIALAQAVAQQALRGVLPIITASGHYVRNSEEARLGPGGGIVLQPRESISASTRVDVPLFAQNAYSDIARAGELSKAERAAYEAQRQQLRGTVVRACWLVESARAVLRVAEQGVLSASEHHESTRRAAEAGTSTRLSVLQAQSELARRRGELTEAHAAVARSELTLGTLLGKAEPVRVQLPALLGGEAPPGSAQRSALVNEALGQRKELTQREAELRASEHGVTGSAMRFLPGISGSFEAFASDQPYLTGDKEGWRAGIDLTWTLYDGQYRYGKRAEAVAQRQRARALQKATQLQISKEVQDALREVQVAEARVLTSTEESHAADETASSAQRSFAAGQATSLDVIDSLDRRTQAAVGLETARANLGLALADLRTARGISW
jgi:outer membrane protein TolC